MAARPIEFIPQKSYRVNDRRSSTGYSRPASNGLYKAATQTGERKFQYPLDRDTHCNVSDFGRRTLMTLGRYLYGNMPTIAGAIEEQAALAAEVFIPQFWGEDRAWGDAAESALIEWSKICDMAGENYDFDTYLEQLSIAALRDGDMATLLTETPDQYPMIQTVPAHRIWSCEPTVSEGEFKGLPMYDGVILSPQRRALGYRVYDEVGGTFTDVSARNMFLTFIPQWADQVRGFSKLASAIFDLQAFRDSRDNELLAQIDASATSLLEWNETGQFDAAKATVFGTEGRTFDATNQATGIQMEKVQGGTHRYFKTNSCTKIEAFSHDRPSANVMAFQENIARDCFKSIDWDYFFSINPGQFGGAPMRIVIDKINRTLKRRRRMLKKAAMRIHGYAIAKLMKLDLLPWSDEWWKWEYQTASRLTSDAKYDSDVDVQELANVITTPQKVCGERGEYWEDVQDQWLDAQARLQKRAKEKGVDLTKVRLGVSSVQNSPPVNPQQSAQAEGNP